MRPSLAGLVVITILSPHLVAAQSTSTADAIDLFLSEAYSVYTEVISILSSNAAPQSTSTSTPALATSSLSSTEAALPTASSLVAQPTAVSTSTSNTETAHSPSSTAAASVSSAVDTRHRNLAIILGSVLGALALGLLLLVFVLCCRRRHRKQSPRRALSPADDEVESWRLNSSNGPHHSSHDGRDAGVTGAGFGAAAASHHGPHSHTNVAPSMAEHPAYRNGQGIENPFIPVPPPPRRTAPNSRAGLTDGIVPGQPPYRAAGTRSSRAGSSELVSTHTGLGGPLSSHTTSPPVGSDGQSLGHNHDSGHGNESALAAGVGGAALGAATMHHHNDHRENDADRSDRRESVLRKPIGAATAGNWHMKTTRDAPTITDNHSNVGQSHRHNKNAGTGVGEPFSPSHGGFKQTHSKIQIPSPGPGHGRNDSLEPLLGGATAGAIGGAALARHHERERSPRRSHEYKSHSHGPIGPGPPGYTTNDINDSSTSNSPDFDSPTQSQPRQHSPFRVSTPPHHHHSPSPSQNGRRLSIVPPAALLAHTPGGHRRTTTPPAVPSRSPRRTRFSDVPMHDPHHPGAESGYDSARTDSGESTWRLSSGMPGGWRNSVDSTDGRRNSSYSSNSGSYGRDSGVSGVGSPVGPGRHGSPGGRRLRLSDLRAQEEERERERGREAGVSGLGRKGFGGGEGYTVGQAM